MVRLSIFDFKLKYTPGRDIANADCLSRLPINVKGNDFDKREDNMTSINHVNGEESVNLNLELIRKNTKSDPVLTTVKRYVMSGWPTKVRDPNLKAYANIKDSLNIDKNCLTMNDRVVTSG